jgi:hypothetical protein
MGGIVNCSKIVEGSVVFVLQVPRRQVKGQRTSLFRVTRNPLSNKPLCSIERWACRSFGSDVVIFVDPDLRFAACICDNEPKSLARLDLVVYRKLVITN